MTYINVNDIEQMISDGKIKHIYLDFDECIVNSIDSVLIQLNRRFDTCYFMDEVNTWNMTNLFPTLKSIEIEEIFDSAEFFDKLTWKDMAFDFVNRYHDIISIVTKGNALNLARKEEWIRSVFPKINFIGLEGTIMDKSMVNMGLNTVHIDDNSDNLESTNAEYKILFENVKNTEWNYTWERGIKQMNGYLEKRFKMKGWK